MDPNMNMATPGPMPQPQPAPQPQPISQPIPQPMSQPNPMANPTLPPSAPSADKGDKTFKIATIIVSVIALAGIGFGVYGMLQSTQKDTDITSLKTQVQNLNTALAAANDNTPDNTTPDDTTTEDTQDYIYVGEWGIKIKIPENLKNVSYEVSNYDNDDSAGTNLCVTGATTGHGDQKPSFIKYVLSESAFVCVTKLTKATENDERLSGMVDKYVIQGPQAITGDGTDADWEVESVNAIKEMLSTDNFTKI